MKNSVDFNQIVESIDEHKKMFKMLGYDLIINENSITLCDISIAKNDQIVGSMILKNKNMYWLKENKEILVNENINNMRFNSIPKKNKKMVFHIVLDDNHFKCNCYNLIGRNYVGLENKKIKIKKHPNYVNIEVKKNEKNNSFNIHYPDRLDKEEEYTNIVNKIFGFEVINQIENYYSQNKTKIRK